MRFIPKDTNIDFLSKAKFAYILSILLIVISFYVWFERGDSKYGVDYKGGTEIIVKLTEAKGSQVIRNALNAAGVTSAIVQSFEKGSEEYSIRVGGSDDKIRKDINKALETAFAGKYSIEKTDVVGPTIGSELREKALIAIIFGLLGILAYISFRFEFAFALGAVAALFHDVIVCTGLYLLSGREISASTLAAALTIVGYSVNDTIIIFDRCREEILRSKKLDLVKIMNSSINATLSRTLITSLLTLFSALALLLYGGGAIADLSLFLVVGIIAGTYSTIFIACPIVELWNRRIEAKAKAKGAVSAS